MRVFEDLPAVVLAFAGPELRVVAANRTARSTMGNRPDVIGRPVREVMPDLEGQQIFEAIEEVYATGQPVFNVERRVLWDRDGDGNLEEGFFTINFAPLRGGDTVDAVLVHAVEATALVRRRQAAESRAVDSERRYQMAREVVVALQQNLLPAGLPVLPRLRLCARYVVADAEAAAGGDWFDAQPLPDGRVALTVGDVVGHGAPAAAVMGQLRATSLQALTSGASITETLTRLDGLAVHLPAARGATVCLALLDPRTGEVEYASRAHPMPLILDPHGPPRFLDGVPDPPLGTGVPGIAVRHDRFVPGQALMLYSDGLVERPGRTPAEGMEELAGVASAALSDPLGSDTTVPAEAADRVCELVVERFAWAGYRDDATLLVAELLTAPHPPLHLEMPATIAALRPMRRAITDWLTLFGVGDADLNALQHAVWEACGNAVEHGYRDHAPTAPPPIVDIVGDIDELGTVRFAIRDHGRWLPAAADPAERGRGLMMMRSMVEQVTVEPSAAGTTVTVRHTVCRPVTVGVSRTRSRTTREMPAEIEYRTDLDRSEHPVLTVHGPVDQSSADRLRTEILGASRGGSLPLTVDLTDVTHLASVGVRLLHQVTGSAGARIRAGAGTPADQVLTLTGLAHTDR